MDEHFKNEKFAQNIPVIHWSVRHMVYQFFRRPNRSHFALRSIHASLCCLLSARQYGEQWQKRRPKRLRGKLPYRPGYLGRARHQWPTCILPINTPGHAYHTLRFYSTRNYPQPYRRPSCKIAQQLFCANRSP